MKGGIYAIVIGSIVTGLGWIFSLQGQAVVGPESSFMYSDPEWVVYGTQIAVAGIVILAAGVVLRLVRR